MSGKLRLSCPCPAALSVMLLCLRLFLLCWQDDLPSYGWLWFYLSGGCLYWSFVASPQWDHIFGGLLVWLLLRPPFIVLLRIMKIKYVLLQQKVGIYAETAEGTAVDGCISC